jgi:hypothetical protein
MADSENVFSLAVTLYQPPEKILTKFKKNDGGSERSVRLRLRQRSIHPSMSITKINLTKI